jgi:hypothetical protein
VRRTDGIVLARYGRLAMPMSGRRAATPGVGYAGMLKSPVAITRIRAHESWE